MDRTEAVRRLASVDEADRDSRAERLLKVDEVLPDGEVGLEGEAAQWLFEDVKATWIYGAFSSTVLTAHAFCIQQLSGIIRRASEFAAPSSELTATNLESLANEANSLSLISTDDQAELVSLHDRAMLYIRAGLQTYDASLSRHISETQRHTDEDPLFVDARLALEIAVRLLRTRST